MNNVLLTFTLLVSTPIFGLQIEVKKEGDISWSEAESKLVEKATEITFSRIASQKVANCAYRNIFRGESKADVRKVWSRQIPNLNKSEKVSVTIHKKPMDGNRLGEAMVGVASIDRRNYQFFNLDISINSDKLKSDADAFASKSGQDKALNRWIQVIAHELVHNLGYHHGSKGDTWESKYPGYFITEIGYCVMSDGQYGSHMGDVGKWKSWKKKYGES